MLKTGPTGIRTQVAEFKVLSDSHYTIGPINSPSPLALIRKNVTTCWIFFSFYIIIRRRNERIFQIQIQQGSKQTKLVIQHSKSV